MKHHYLLISILLFLLSPILIDAQGLQIDWERTLGGFDKEEVKMLRQTSDGGYILVGSSKSGQVLQQVNHNQLGTTDGLVIKLNSAGDVIWTRMMGSYWNDTFNDVLEASDGGYIIVGTTTFNPPGNETVENDGDVIGYHGQRDIWALKLDADGNTLWSRCLGGSLSEDCLSMCTASDGGYILACTTNSSDGDIIGVPTSSNQPWIIKLTDDGVIQWQNMDADIGSRYPMRIIPTNDMGYIMTGIILPNNNQQLCNHGMIDCFLTKLNVSGEVEWDQCYGGNGDDYSISVIETSDGGYCMVGQSDSDNDYFENNGIRDVLVIKSDPFGSALWIKSFGGSDNDSGMDIIETDNNQLMIISHAHSNDGDVTGLQDEGDIWILNLDQQGNLNWEQTISKNNIDYGNTLQQTTDGGYILSGVTSTWEGSYLDYQGQSKHDIWVAKLSSIVSVNEHHAPTLSLYPNPATHHITLTGIERGSAITIHDITGKLMHTSTVQDVQTTISTAHLVSGVYTVQVQHDDVIRVQRLVVNH